MKRVLAALLLCVSLSGCLIVPAQHGHHQRHAYQHHTYQRFTETQHPLVGADGRWRLMGDSAYRSWMFEPQASKPLPK